MGINAWLRAMAGLFVVVSVVLGSFVGPWFFAFAAFVGRNLSQSVFSDWYPMIAILKEEGVRAD